MNIEETSIRLRPRWVDEEAAILGLLETFLHKLEKGHRLRLRVNAKSVPALFDFTSGDTQYIWSLIKSLNNEYHIVSIRYARNKPYQETYDNAQLVFNPDKENLVREWLNRPALDPYTLVWQDTLHRLRHHFEDHGQALAEQMVRLPDKGPEQTLRAFAQLSTELQRPTTLRALSARCFWGDSKYLDHRESLIHQLFPLASQNLAPRPILMNIHLPEILEQVLFIENQDTFLALSDIPIPSTAVVYSAGFRGSAARIREPGHVAFGYLNPSPAKEAFEQWWFEVRNNSLQTRFWGDLDFAGIAILKALKSIFMDIEAWKPGYAPLLERLHNDNGHEHESSGKERQKDPGLSGCDYADTELLPAMRRIGQFIDQESVLMDELKF